MVITYRFLMAQRVWCAENVAEVANVQRMLVREHLDFLESDEHRARLTIRCPPR